MQGLDWRSVKKALKDVGAPTTARELEITDDEVVEALVGSEAILPDRYTILSRLKLDGRRAREVAETAGVI
jgi:glycerol-1-phosphate dehydrogenase [NAD(P)+]